MKQTRWMVLTIILGVFLMSGCSNETNQYTPEEVINNALKEKNPLGSYYAEAEMTIEFGEEVEHLMLKEWQSEDGKTKAETQHVDGSNSSVSVNNGEEFIIFEEEQNKAFILEDPELLEFNKPSPKEQAMHLLEMIRDTHEISSKGEEEIIGRTVYHLKAEAKENNQLLGDQEMWIDKESWLVLKLISQSGDSVSEMAYTKIDFDPEFSADTFSLTLPDDVIVENLDEVVNEPDEITLEDAVKALQTSFYYIPEEDGIEISTIEKIELAGVEIQRTEIDMTYVKNDLPLLSIGMFEAPEGLAGEDLGMPGEEEVTIRNQQGFYTEMEGFRGLLWQEDGLNYSVVIYDPNFTLEDIQQLAETMIVAE